MATLLEPAVQLPTSNARSAGFCPDALGRIDRFYGEMVGGGLMPNMAYALARKGQVFARGHMGWADRETGRPIEADSIYRLLSLTKAYSGVAAMILVEAGLIRVDDPVADYVPAFASMKVWTETGLVPARTAITIDHLVTHMSGLTSGFFAGPVPDLYLANGLQEGTREAQQPTLAEYVDKLASLPLIAEPGTAWNYSEGLAVLGRIVEIVSGMRYADFLKTHLFDPIGAPDTGFFVPDDQQHRLVKLYAAQPFTGGLEECTTMRFPRPGGPTFHPLDVTRQPGADLGGAGLAGTVDDVLRFAMMLAGKGALGEARVLKPESVAELRRGRVIDRLGRHAMMKMPLDERGVGLDMGMGIVVVREPELARDAGGQGSFSFGGSAGTRFWVDPELELAAVFFTQTINSPAPYFAPFSRFVYEALRAGSAG